MYLKKESLSHLIYTFDEILSIQILLRHDLFVTIFCYCSDVGYGADIVPAKALEERRHLVKKALCDF